MKFDILNRHTGRVQFTAEIECADNAPRSMKIRLAVIWALRNEADLSEANLSGADLFRADLRGANLRGADLRGAKGYITGPHRSDGYRFDLRLIDGSWRVVAGCNTTRDWTTDEYREHARTYIDDAKHAETLAILDYLDVRAKQEDAA